MPRWYWLLLLPCPFFAFNEPVRTAAPPRSEPHRSPIDLAVLPGAKRALSANHTADSVSLIDLAEGRVLFELRCGHKPAGVACSSDGRRAIVANLWSGTLTWIEVRNSSLVRLAETPAGHLPRGVVFAPDGKSVYVAVSGAEEVVQFDWQTHKALQRWSAPKEPRRVMLTRDGSHLVAVSSRSGQVRCWDTRSHKQVWERTVSEAINLVGLGLSPDDRDVFTAQVHHRHHPMLKANIEQGWAVDNRLARMSIASGKSDDYEQIALDVRGKAVADPSAVALSPKKEFLVVAAGGTAELVLLSGKDTPWVREPGDFLDVSFDQGEGRYRRVALGGRPMTVQFLGESDQVVTANYLLDAVQVVDVRVGKVVRTIALGGPKKPSLVRQGEAIFYDAKRSHHQWFSCHTCHTDGHTCGQAFDTLNDESTNNPKMTPTLRGVTKTGPWTWHGWQKSLSDAVEKSLTETMWGPEPTPQEVKAVVAFLGTLEHPTNPHLLAGGKRSVAAERGQAIFRGKARCDRCHQGEYFTSPKTYDVKLPADGSPFDQWNPPSLRGVYDRGPFLHDGRAESLDELLRVLHAPEVLGGKMLTPAERKDLVEYLKSL